MAKQLITLKFLMGWNAVKASTFGLVMGIFATLGFLQVAGLVYTGILALASWGEPEYLAMAVTAVGSIALLLWLIVPAVISGIDETLDPRAFATFLPPSPALARAFILATGAGPAGIATALVLVALPTGFFTAKMHMMGFLSLAMMLLTLVMAWTWSRVVTSALTLLFTSNSRLKDLATTLGALVFLGALAPLGIWMPLIVDNFNAEAVAAALDWLVWLPFVAPWGVVWSVFHGAYTAAGAQFALSLAFFALGALIWLRQLPVLMAGSAHPLSADARDALAEGRYLIDPALEHSTSKRASQRHVTPTASGPSYLKGADLWTRMGLPSPAAALAARTLRDWLTDPRVNTNALAALIFPFMAVALPRVSPDAPEELGFFFLFFAPIVLGAAVGGLPSYDSTAFWLLCSSGIRGRDERLGRMAGSAILHVPLLMVTTAIAGYFMGFKPIENLALILIVMCLYAATTALTLILSARWVYPVQPPGTSPLAAKGVSSMGTTLLLQFGGQIGSLLLCAPALVLFIVAWNDWGVALWVSSVASAVWWLLMMAITPVVAGKVWDRHSVDVLRQIRSWPGH